MLKSSLALILGTALFCSCGGDEIGSSTLAVAWTFDSGDCASNDIETVTVAITPGESFEFACSAGTGDVGEITTGGTYQITAQGLDEDGIARFESFGQSASFPDGRTVGPIDILLRPKTQNVTVTWNGCPGSVQLPFFITLYEPPAVVGGDLTATVGEAQEGCATREVVLENIAPGSYVAEVDSRAVTPAVLGTADVMVIAGEDAEVHVPVP